jgi:DNA-binding NtrC family response regulator
VVAATHRDLEALVREGKFREDLYWRLNVFTIAIPALRERTEDIPALSEHFLGRFAQAMGRPPMRVSAEALEALRRHSWPGNVRELQNAVERAVVVSSGTVIEAKDLPVQVTGAPARPSPGSLAEAEKAHILAVLAANAWNITRSARTLDVDRVTLYNKIRRYDLKRPGDGT